MYLLKVLLVHGWIAVCFLMFTFFPGGFLIGRTVAVLITMTIGTSMAARQGPLAMAAHQICMQVWLAVSLLTDGLAASGQV